MKINKILRRLSYMSVLMLFIVSCNERKVVSTDFVQTETENDTETITQQSCSDISEKAQEQEELTAKDHTFIKITEKMQKQKQLTETDFDYICDFLFNNIDESISEGIGRSLFEYLQNNQLNNSAFLLYLNKKGVPYTEKVLHELVYMMCIDIGEEKYSYDTFIKDFEMFKNSVSAKNAFDTCMINGLFND